MPSKYKVLVLDYSGEIYRKVYIYGIDWDDVVKKLDHKYFRNEKVMGYIIERLGGQRYEYIDKHDRGTGNCNVGRGSKVKAVGGTV